MGDDVIVTSFKFSQNNCPYSKSIEPTNFRLGTNTQQHNVHLMIKDESDLDGWWRSQAKVKGHEIASYHPTYIS